MYIYIKDRMTFKKDRAECWQSKPIGCVCSYNTFDGCLDAVCLTPRLPARSRQTTHQPEWQAKARLRLADRLYFYFKGLKMVHYSISSVWTTLTNTQRVVCLQHWLVDCIRRLDSLLTSILSDIWYWHLHLLILLHALQTANIHRCGLAANWEKGN